MLNLTIEVPMRDGVVLRGLHHAPEATPAPTVLALTPYGADRYHPDGVHFALRGYHLVTLDCRGRGDSSGSFVPFARDGVDGHDAVEWITAQPWSDGNVVTYGGSYSGFTQWAVAASSPAGLRAIAPVAAVYPGVDFPMVGNVPQLYAARWLTLVDGRRQNRTLFDDVAMWDEAGRELVRQNRPMRDLDLVAVGRRLPAFQNWLDHPSLDEFWAGLVPDGNGYAGITVPVLTITGQYDDDQLGALRYHDEHLAVVPAARHHVVIGPWDHAGTRSGARSFGGLTFAESSALDLKSLHADWFDWVLGRGPRPEFLVDRVVYFHIGADEWRSAAAIPSGPSRLELYPVEGRSLSVAKPVAAQEISLALDPRDTALSTWDPPSEETVFTDGAPLRDAGSMLYVTEPLAAVDIAGRMVAHLTLSSELPDFDLLLGLYLLSAPDGAPAPVTVTWLGEAMFRARYHASMHHSAPWPAGTPTRVSITGFPFVSRRLSPGDRLALLIRPPHRAHQTNMQTGGVAADETVKDAVAGTVRLLQDPGGPSCLVVPLA